MDAAAVEAAITPAHPCDRSRYLYGQPLTWSRCWRSRAVTASSSSRMRRRHWRESTTDGGAGRSRPAAFSFYPTKNLGAYGEGGAVVTNNAHYAARMRMLRDWGQEKKYEHRLKGFNYAWKRSGAILRVSCAISRAGRRRDGRARRCTVVC